MFSSGFILLSICLSECAFVAAASFVHVWIERPPLALYVEVGFHFDLAFRPFESVALVIGNEVGEEECVGSFCSVFGEYADEEEVYGICFVELDGAQEVVPSEGEESSASASLECSGEGGERDAYAYEFAVGVPIFDECDEVEVGVGEVHVDVLSDLARGEFGIAVKVFECGVDKFEDACSVSALEDVFLGEFFDAQVVAFTHHLCDFGIFLGDFIGDVHLVFHVVIVFFVATECLHVLGIIGVVVGGGHGAEMVESCCEHAFGVHIGEAERSYNLLHAVGASVVFDGAEQSSRDFAVVDEINPAEAHAFTLPFFVGFMVDDGCDASDDAVVFVGEEIFRLAKIESCVFVFAQRIELVAIKVGHVVRVACIQVVMKFNECL